MSQDMQTPGCRCGHQQGVHVSGCQDARDVTAVGALRERDFKSPVVDIVTARCLIGEQIQGGFEVQGLRASWHEVGMVGSCPYLDATNIYSARHTKLCGMGPMVALRAVGHNKVQADVEAAFLNVQEACRHVMVLRTLV